MKKLVILVSILSACTIGEINTPEEVGSLRGVGEICKSDDDCQVSACQSGFCTTTCDNETSPCEVGETCVQKAPNENAFCYSQCLSDSDCSAGQKCREYNPVGFQSSMVCWW